MTERCQFVYYKRNYGFCTYSSAPASTNSDDFWARCSRTSSEIFIEQNFGPHIEQKWATLAPSAGRVSSWKSLAVSGSSDRWNWSLQRNSNRAFDRASSRFWAPG